jgi:SAM-dependent methyltransferase
MRRGEFLSTIVAFFMSFMHSPVKSFKTYVKGVVYLLFNPKQLKHLVVRETLYGKRLSSKQKWVEWQLYDTCVGNVLHCTATAQVRPLNVERLEIISDIFDELGDDLQVLDVGCGDGSIGHVVSEMGHSVFSVELPKAATVALRRGVSPIVAGDAEHLSFSSTSFDVVVASEVVEHLWNPMKLLEESYRVLRDEGFLMISTPEGREGLYYDSHKHFFTVASLEELLKGKFVLCEVKRLKPKGALMPTIILLFRKLGNDAIIPKS